MKFLNIVLIFILLTLPVFAQITPELKANAENGNVAAHRNAENVIILWNTPKVAKIYIDKWIELWDEGEQLSPAY